MTQQPTPAPADVQPQHPYTAAAFEQEQEHLTRAMQIAQAEHLLNRAVALAADNARQADQIAVLQAQVEALEEEAASLRSAAPTPGD